MSGSRAILHLATALGLLTASAAGAAQWNNNVRVVRPKQAQPDASTRPPVLSSSSLYAVQVTALEAKLAEFVRLFVGCIPDQCVPRESPEERPNYPLGLAWHDTANALAEAEDQIENLGDLIRGKAGITLEEARAAIAESQEQPATAELVST